MDRESIPLSRSHVRWPVVRAVLIALALLLGGGEFGAWAQRGKPKIWDVPLGTHVSNLPIAEFVAPACGTNGGPAGLPLGGFDKFDVCPGDAATGLHEVSFNYDDTQEYVYLAQRAPEALRGRHVATAVLGQPAILSFLIDGGGRIQGYRIFTDPRAEPHVRQDAFAVSIHFKARMGEDWDCVDLPRKEGENPIAGSFIKELCQKESTGRRMTVETHYYYRPGQQRYDPHRPKLMVNEFESGARLEVLQVDPLPDEVIDRLDATVPGRDLAAKSFPTEREAFLAGYGAHCPGCDLAGADLRRRDLTGADLTGANLAGAVLHRAILSRADLTNANLSGANLNRADLTFATLRGADLANAMLYQADAARADFSGADLYYVSMGKARLALANFEKANLDLADLGEARMNDANLANATLNGAYMNQAVLLRADLRAVVAEDAILAEASLADADLSDAMVRSADFYGADLSGANLSNANFSGARLQSAILLNTNQSGTVFAGALMPDNTRRR